MRGFHQISFVCASAGLGLLLACPTDPPDAGECGVDSCYLPCNEDDECEIGGELCRYADAGNICWPECDGSACPENGECIYNPDSTGNPCDDTMPCDVPGETCQENANGDLACLLAPSHCVPTCVIDECTPGLVCDETGFCVVPY